MPAAKPKVTVADDGTLIYEFPKGAHAVITGPIQGEVVCDDGTRVNVSPHVIGVESAERAAEVAHHIGRRYEHEGHPSHTDGVPFRYLAPSKEN